MQIENKEYIAHNLLINKHEYKYADDASFLEEGIGNSQGVMELAKYNRQKSGS